MTVYLHIIGLENKQIVAGEQPLINLTLSIGR